MNSLAVRAVLLRADLNTCRGCRFLARGGGFPIGNPVQLDNSDSAGKRCAVHLRAERITARGLFAADSRSHNSRHGRPKLCDAIDSDPTHGFCVWKVARVARLVALEAYRKVRRSTSQNAGVHPAIRPRGLDRGDYRWDRTEWLGKRKRVARASASAKPRVGTARRSPGAGSATVVHARRRALVEVGAASGRALRSRSHVGYRRRVRRELAQFLQRHRPGSHLDPVGRVVRALLHDHVGDFLLCVSPSAMAWILFNKKLELIWCLPPGANSGRIRAIKVQTKHNDTTRVRPAQVHSGPRIRNVLRRFAHFCKGSKTHARSIRHRRCCDVVAAANRVGSRADVLRRN